MTWGRSSSTRCAFYDRSATQTGVLGVSLVAHPLRREFWTLSAWRDREVLTTAVRQEPHRTVMARYRTTMADSTFDFWPVAASELPVSWTTARRRIRARAQEA